LPSLREVGCSRLSDEAIMNTTTAAVAPARRTMIICIVEE
jgi:hypothetical protein